ncbi:MAG: hypothetical protein KC415_12250 [Anaerolineales bacterium]|nr:hypothetical protein [Anaerolineales bacterium]
MATQELTYKGKKIIITVENGRAQMTIDGEPIPVGYDSGTGSAVALNHMPFKSHSSLVELAKSVIDNVISKRK